MTYLFNFHVVLAWRTPYCGIFELKRDGVTYYFVDNEYYFKRAGLYGHYDDAERFAFFSRAVVETPAHLDWHPDVLHANDWQTALAPIYLLEERTRTPQLYGTKSVFTIHNIEYQGRYGKELLEDLFGLNSGYFHEHMLAYHGDINLMKGAIYASDYVTTVSPSYANELQYPFYAHGLEGVIADNLHKLRGILNGIDTALYDPSADQGLAAVFSPDDLSGKATCKTALQQAVGLRQESNIPIIACVSRLVKHKGFELVASAIHDIMAMDVQMVVLGTGDWNFEEAFRHAQAQYPGRFSANILYSGRPFHCHLRRRRPLPYAQHGRTLRPEPDDRHALWHSARGAGDRRPEGLRPAQRHGAGQRLLLRGHQRPRYDLGAGGGRGPLPQQQGGLGPSQHNAMTADFSWNQSAQDYLQVYYWVTGFSAPAPV